MTNPRTYKALPARASSERAMIGALLFAGSDAPAKLAEIMTIAARDAWADPAASAALDAIRRVVERGEPVDSSTIWASIEVQGTAEIIGGLPGLLRMGEHATAHGVGVHATLVGEAARVREHVVELGRLAELGRDPDTLGDPSAFFAGVAAVSRSAIASIGDPSRPACEVALESFAGFARRQRGDRDPACPTGIASLDADLAGGFRARKLYVIAARPGVGKSALMTSVIASSGLDPAASPMRVASLEMDEHEIHGRIILARASVTGSVWQAQRGGSASEFDRLTRATELVSKSTLRVDDQTTNFATIEALIEAWAASVAHPHCERIAAEHPDLPRRVPVAWIDYLQLCEIAGMARGTSREERVGAMTRRLKLLSRRANVAIVLLAQINRENVKAGRRPRSSDLRESGSIEQDADSIILLHRDTDEPGQTSQPVNPLASQPGPRRLAPDEIELILDKNRGGRTGVHVARWIGDRTLIQDRGASWNA